MIWLQAICFGSYLVANILLFIEIAVFSASGTPQHQAGVILTVWIISLFLNFITQTSLIMIFLEIGKRNPFAKKPVEDNKPRIQNSEASRY
jgi:hypothetical protein